MKNKFIFAILLLATLWPTTESFAAHLVTVATAKTSHTVSGLLPIATVEALAAKLAKVSTHTEHSVSEASEALGWKIMSAEEFVATWARHEITCPGNVCTVTDCTVSAIETAISNGPAANGDTVEISSTFTTASPCTATWNGNSSTGDRLTITLGITLTAANDCDTNAAGIPTACPVVITDGTSGSTTNDQIFLWTCAAGQYHELSNFQFTGARSTRGLNGIIRINCLNTTTTRFNITRNMIVDMNSNQLFLISNVIGVFHHNYIHDIVSGTYTFWVWGTDWNTTVGADVNGDRSWAATYTFGEYRSDGLFTSGTPNGFYVEDNVMIWPASGTRIGVCADGLRGGRWVARFNYTLNCRWTVHGTESSLRIRSGLGAEIYANYLDFTGSTSTAANKVLNLRGGTAAVFLNTLHNATSSPRAMDLDQDRATQYYPPWAQSDGTPNTDPGQTGNPGGQWDVNDPAGPFTTGTVVSQSTNTITISTGATWTANQWENYALRKDSCTPSRTPSQVNCHSLINSNTACPNGGNPCTLTFENPSQSGVNTRVTFTAGDAFTVNKVLQHFDGVGRSSSASGAILSGGSGNPPVQPSNTFPTDLNDQVTYPAYQWLNNDDGANIGIEPSNSCDATCRANEHYFNYVGSVQSTSGEPQSPFNGQYGMGVGTRASPVDQRPNTCAAGVGFWATDAGSWNSGTSAVIDFYTSAGTAYTGQGVLDKCTATDTWTNAVYTPVTYPHPMNSTTVTTITVSVETLADGTGVTVPSQSVSNASGTVTAYCIRRTNGTFTSNDACTWSLTNKTGSVVNGDLVAAGDSKSAVFTGSGIGTALIHAEETINTVLYSGDSGTITVIDTIAPTPGGGGAINCNNSVTSSTFSCTWTAGTDTVTAVGSLQYLVCRSTANNISSVSTCEAKVVQSYLTAITSYAATGLAASTSYYHNVVIMDEAGNKNLYTADEQTTAAGSGAVGGAGGGLARSRPDDPRR